MDKQQHQQWNDFVAASPQGTVLQTLEWGELKKPDWQPLPLEARESGTLVATALVLKRKLPGGKSLFYVPRGPVLDWTQPHHFGLIMDELVLTAQKHSAISIKIDPPIPDKSTFHELLRRNGFAPSPDAHSSFGGTQPRCVMKLDIAEPLDEVMKKFHTKWRYNIRLAKRKGVEVNSDCKREDLPVFHDIYEVTAQRDGFTGYPLSYFEKMWDVLVEKNMAKLFMTSHEGKVLSGAIAFILGRQCWYVFGASSNQKRNLMPNHAMQWAMMEWAKSQGCEVYDFRGVHNIAPDATPDDLLHSKDGLVRFKAGFNAQLVRYCGEWDLPISRPWHWAWTTLRPAVRRLKKRVMRS